MVETNKRVEGSPPLFSNRIFMFYFHYYYLFDAWNHKFMLLKMYDSVCYGDENSSHFNCRRNNIMIYKKRKKETSKQQEKIQPTINSNQKIFSKFIF